MNIKSSAAFMLGWLVPGLGHVSVKKYRRGVVFFVCITCMTILGLLMGGKIYGFQTENPLTILAFFSDLGLGATYILAKLAPFGMGSLKSITFEFGTAYIAGAGLMNFLVALDAMDIAAGKKS